MDIVVALPSVEDDDDETKRVFMRLFASATDLIAGSSDKRAGGPVHIGQPPLASDSRLRRLSTALAARRDLGHTMANDFMRCTVFVEIASAIVRMTRDDATTSAFVTSYANPAIVVMAADSALRAMGAVQSLHAALATPGGTETSDVRAYERVMSSFDDVMAAAYVGLGLESRRKHTALRRAVVARACVRSAGAFDVVTRLDDEPRRPRYLEPFIGAANLLRSTLASISVQRVLVVGGATLSAVGVIETLKIWVVVANLPPVTAFGQGVEDGLVGGLVRIGTSIAHGAKALVVAPQPLPIEAQESELWKVAAMYIGDPAIEYLGGPVALGYGYVRDNVASALTYTVGALYGTATRNIIPRSFAQFTLYVFGYVFLRAWYQKRVWHLKNIDDEQRVERELTQFRARTAFQARTTGEAVAKALEHSIARFEASKRLA